MLFTKKHFTVEDIRYLPENEQKLFNPRPFTGVDDIKGNCIYGYLRIIDDENGPAGSLIYIGEGSSKRPTRPHSIPVPPPEFIVIYQDGITKKEAREGEKILIRHYGRIKKGTGILTNSKHAAGGHEDPVPPRKITSCKFCNLDFKHTSYHEKRCSKNPNRSKGVKNLTYIKCEFCDQPYSKTQMNQHLRACENNPDKKSPPHEILKCKYCEKSVMSSALPHHERSCNSNSERVDGTGKGRKYDKKKCKYCDKSVSGNNIAIHERHCHENLNRIPGVRHGKKKINDK